MQHRASFAKGLVWISSWVAFAGCPEEAQPSDCAPENEIRGVCAGVPVPSGCEGEPSIQDVPCEAVTRASSDAELQMAAAQAATGTCIALAPGHYGAVDIAGGVSLLGSAAGCVTVGPVTLNAGTGAVVRGLTASSIHVKGASEVKIESVHVLGSSDTGVLVDAQSSVRMITSTIEGSAGRGLHASDSTEVHLDRVILAGSAGPGVLIESSSPCPALPAQPVFTVTSSIVRGNHVAGIVLSGTRATLQGIDILRTLPGSNPLYGQGGGGLSISQCSAVSAAGLRVHDSVSFGVLVEQSAAILGDSRPDGEIEIHRSRFGLVIRDVTSFSLENAWLDENKGIGIGVSGGSKGVVIRQCGVSRTRRAFVPTTGVDSVEVGYGLVWVEQSSAELSDVSLSGNALASVLIDGAASGMLHHVTLSGGDEALGIVQQRHTGGAQPAVTAGTPALAATAEQLYPIPPL